MQSSRSLRFARNVSWNILGQVAVAALNFFLIPYLIAKMGVEAYGLYILLHAAASYLQLSSLGAGSAALKHLAAYHAAGNQRGIGQVLRYSLSIYCWGAALAAALLVLGAEFFLERLFRVPDFLTGAGVFVLRCAAAGAFFVAVIQRATIIMQAFQRFDLHNLVLFLQNSLLPLGAAAVLSAGLGVKGVALWYVAVNAFVALTAALLVRRIVPSAEGPAQGHAVLFKTFLWWGLSQWVGPLAWIVIYQFDKIFIARGVAFTSLAHYCVPAGFLQRLQIVPAMVSTVIMTMMLEVQGAESDDSVKRIYLKSVRFVLWAVLPILALLFAVMPQFLGLWLGGEFSSRSVWPARFLVLTQVFFLLNTMPGTVALVRDKPWHVSATAGLHAALSLLAWKLLTPSLGLTGVALGSLVAQAVPACLYIGYLHRRVLRVSFREYLEHGLWAPGMSAALLLAAVFPWHPWATGWVRLGMLAGIGFLVYYCSTWLLMSREDRDLLRNYLRYEGGRA